jgi:8-oxo-dGTP pyrophosphatase MutT (NUDIX family)
VTFRKVASRPVHRGRVFTLQVETFESPDGEQFERDLIRHPGAVAVLPITDDGDVVFVRQFRPAIGEDLLEIPAGLLDVVGEPLEVAAARELAEEVGLRADRLELLTTFVAAPGMADERVTLFRARGLVEVGQNVQGPEERHMTVEKIPFALAVAMVHDGTITDAKTVIALLFVASQL